MDATSAAAARPAGRRERRRARARARGPWWRWTRRALLGLAGLLGTILGLVGLALLLLQTDWGRARALSIGLDAVNGAIRGRLEVDRVDGDFLTWVALEGVRVRDPDGQLVASLDRVSATFSLGPLLDRRVAVASVAIEGPSVLVTDGAGGVPLAAAFAPRERTPEPEPEDAGAGAWVVEVGALALRDGRVRLAPDEGALALEGLRVEGRASIGAAITWSDVVIAAALRNLPVDDLRIATSGQLARGGLTLRSLDVDAGPHAVSLTGRVPELARPTFDLALPRLRLDLGALASRLADGPDRLPLRGVIDGRAALQGPLTALRARVGLSSPAGRLRLAATADLAGAEPRVDLTLQSPRLAPGGVVTTLPADVSATLAVRAVLAGTPPAPTAAADVTLVLSDLRSPLPAPEQIALTATLRAGRAAIHLATSGPGEQAIDVSADVDLARGLAPHGDPSGAAPPAPARLAFDLRAVDLATWGALVGRPDLAGVVELLGGEATAQLTADGLRDVRATLALRARGLAAATAPPPPAAATLDDAPAPQRAALATADVRVTAAWAGGAALPTGTVNAELTALEAAGVAAERTTVDLALAGVAGGGEGGVRARGSVVVRRLSQGNALRVARVDLPVDVTLGPDGLPRGQVGVKIRDARQGALGLRQATLDGRVSAGDGVLRLAGPLAVEGITLPGRGRVRTARVTADLSYDLARGRLRGGLKTEVRDARLGDLTLARAVVDLDVRLGAGGALRAGGTVAAFGLRSGADGSVGSVLGDVSVDLAGGRPAGRATLTARGVRLPGRSLREVRLAASLDRRGAARVDLRAEGRKERVALIATADLPLSGRRDLRVRVESLEALAGEDGIRVADGAEVFWAPNRRIAARGLWLRGVGRLAGQSLGVDGSVDLRSGALQGELDAQSLVLEDWLVVVRGLAATPLLGDLALAGQLGANVRFEGTLREPDVQGYVSLRDGVVGPLQRVFADIALRVGPEGLHAELMGEWAEDARLTGGVDLPIEARLPRPGEVRFHLPPDRELGVDLRAEGIDLSLLRPFLPPSRRGELSGRGDLTVLLGGTLQEPRGGVQLTTDGLRYDTLEHGVLSVDVLLRQARTEARVSLRDVRRDVEPLRIVLDVPENLVAALQGRRDGEAVVERLRRLPFALELRIPETRLGDLPLVRALAPTLARTRAVADLRLAGPLVAPRFGGHLAAFELPAGRMPTDVDVTLRTSADGVVSLSGDVTSGGTWLAGLAATLPDLAGLTAGDLHRAGRDERFLVRATVSGVPLETAARFSPALGRVLTGVVRDGSLSADVHLRGTAEGPQGHVFAHVTGDHRVRPGDLAPLAQSVDLSLHVLPAETRAVVLVAQGAGGGALIAEAHLAHGSDAVLAGTLGDVAALPLRATVRTTTDGGPAFAVRGLSRLAPAVFGATEGALDIGLEVGGTLGRPEPRGYVEARFDRLDVSAAGLVQESDPPLAVRLEVTPDRIHLVPLTLRSGGTMDLTFDLDVPPDFSVKNMPMRGSVVLKDLWVDRRHSPKVDARLDGSVQVEGTVAAPVVRGRVEVRRAEIAPDVGVRDVAEVKDPEDVVFVAPELLVLPAEERGRLRPVAPVSALVLALEVKLPFRSVHLGNELMDLWVSGDLTLGAKGGGLSIEGTVTVDEGRVALYGKEFVVGEESRVTFDGSVPVNPRLALQASYGISNVDLSPIDLAADADSRLTVTVTGSAAAPKVEITSTPAMAEADIVSILLFDAPSRQPDLGQGTANLFVGAALGGLTKALQKDLPVDVLKVEGGEQGLVDARIQVGKRLTRDLMVVYEANLGAEVDENANTLRVQYEFTRHLQLETHFGDKGEGGVDLVLRWRW